MTTSAPDLEVVLSRQLLQYALTSYAAEYFLDQEMRAPQLGLSARGQDMQLELHAGAARLHVRVAAVWRMKAWNLRIAEQRDEVALELQAQFEVHDNELFIRVSDGRVLSRELAWLEKVGSQLVHMVVEQFLSRPLIRLPVRLDITGAASEGDESRLNLDHVWIEPESVRLSLRLIHDLVPPPPAFADVVIAGARPRAIRLTRKTAAAAQAGRRDEARSLVREALEADNSYAMGWLWLAALAEQPADRRVCLERVVAIDPANTAASAALARITDAV
ncbi:hypothetical protein K2Z83_24470 [Oscillochloris sp. ZM17-4]|uniref:hypothetical protein n=1 Tax=Oscillochloris sp. ZM17-4 TaxID=2866714 RepID=UPI001C72D0FD|nr:hypothetical protein [Oscillochloris sp. ZM17-4]MBX0330817.1 hypothetical protein [Oscillochloris sp. ZM17-4]